MVRLFTKNKLKSKLIYVNINASRPFQLNKGAQGVIRESLLKGKAQYS